MLCFFQLLFGAKTAEDCRIGVVTQGDPGIPPTDESLISQTRAAVGAEAFEVGSVSEATRGHAGSDHVLEQHSGGSVQVADAAKRLDQDGTRVVVGNKIEQLQHLVQGNGGGGIAALDQAVEEEITRGDAGEEAAPLEPEQGIDRAVVEPGPNEGPDEEIDGAEEERGPAEQSERIEQRRNGGPRGDDAGEDEVEAGAGGGGGEDGDEGGIGERVEGEAGGVEVAEEGEGAVGVVLEPARGGSGGGVGAGVAGGRVGVEEACGGGGGEELRLGEGGGRREERPVLGAP